MVSSGLVNNAHLAKSKSSNSSSLTPAYEMKEKEFDINTYLFKFGMNSAISLTDLEATLEKRTDQCMDRVSLQSGKRHQIQCFICPINRV